MSLTDDGVTVVTLAISYVKIIVLFPLHEYKKLLKIASIKY